MKKRLVSSIALILAACASAMLAPDVARSDHATYSSAVERFEMTGASVTNFVDEFDDDLTTGWAFIGTAVESGGVLELKDPGQHQLYVHPDGFSFVGEGSIAFCTGCSAVGDGSGDFSVLTIWKNQTFPADYFVIQGMSFFEGATQVGLGVTLGNYGPGMAPSLGGLTGLFATFSNSEFTYAAGDPPTLTNTLLESDIVQLSSLPEDYAFKLDYDDTTNTFTAAYSTDGGSNFTAFGGSYTAASGWTGSAFSLQVDPRESVSSTPVPSLSPFGTASLVLGLAGLVGLTAKRRLLT